MEGTQTKEYKAKIYFLKNVKYCLETSLKIEAESRDKAREEIDRMVDAYVYFHAVEDEGSPFLARLIELCEDDIMSFEEDDDNRAEGAGVEQVYVFGIEEVQS